MRPIITLTTDFGTRDSYVGVMKSVMLSICPDAHLIDITHEIEPQDIVQAALVVRACAAYFPPGTVHLVVVDPGVGTVRQPVAMATPQSCYVGPNNGVFGLVWKDALARWSAAEVQSVVLSEPRFWRPQVSSTFHGRDIFAPVAAWLASGASLWEVGSPLDQLIVADIPLPVWEEGGTLRGEVVAIDRFGNCISNITAADLERLGAVQQLSVIIGERRFNIGSTYGEVATGQALALVGSNGYLEVAVRDGSASHIFHIGRGTQVRVEQTALSAVE